MRVPETGELRQDADYDRDMLRHVSMLKLNDEEAEVLGDPAALLVPEVVVTHGSRGSTLYVNGRPEKVPAFPLAGRADRRRRRVLDRLRRGPLDRHDAVGRRRLRDRGRRRGAGQSR